MIPKRIAGATHTLGTPRGWDESRHGKCASLAVRIENGVCASAWELTPKEIRAIANGGHVVLHIWGGQPPVALTVELPDDDGTQQE
jgi:hypothetical protein